MAENTTIEWADHTFNPWEGCQKIGLGCLHCYAETRNARFGGGVAINWGPGAPRRRTSASNWQLPIKWDRASKAKGIRYRVFCASLGDWLDNEVPIEWLVDALDVIRTTQHLDWLLLSKRIGVWRTRMQDAIAHAMLTDRLVLAAWMADWVNGKPPAHVWIGATVVNQEEADRDIPKLLAAPAVKRFLSMEPLLGPVELGHWIGTTKAIGATTFRDENNIYRCDLTGTPVDGIDWVIVGGESGPRARPMHPDWARSLRDQCAAAGVPYLFKQWGEWREPEHGENFDTSMGRAAKPPAFILSETGTVHCFESEHIVNGTPVIKVGKKAAGRLLDGRTWDEVPA